MGSAQVMSSNPVSDTLDHIICKLKTRNSAFTCGQEGGGGKGERLFMGNTLGLNL